jgi:hypothetical protein
VAVDGVVVVMSAHLIGVVAAVYAVPAIEESRRPFAST